jgi:Carbohydrate esterase, sialic acid-specific acetylesterase
MKKYFVGGIFLSLFFASFLGIAVSKASAAIFVQDTFSGSANTNLKSHTGQIGAKWTIPSYRSKSVEVLTGAGSARVGGNSSTESVYLPSGTPLGPNYSVQATIATPSIAECGSLGARFGSSAYSGYMVGGCGGVTAFYKYLNGTQTTLATLPYTFIANNTVTFKFSVVTVNNNATLTLYVNGTQVGSTYTDVSNPILTAGKPALWLNAKGKGYSNTASYLIGNLLATDITAPTVTVQAATAIGNATATLNGTITVDGNSPSTVRGFNYGLTTSYGSTVSSTGTFGVGAFNQNASGLTPNTTYHYQAYATNATGTAKSGDQAFTTTAAVATSYTLIGPTSGVLNVASSVFTVTPNGAYTGTITPGSTGAGTFAPASLTFTNSSAPQTFTYTPTTTTGSPHVISAVSNPALVNPPSINFTVLPPPITQDSFTDTTGTPLGLHTGEIGASWKVNESILINGATPTNFSTTSALITAAGRARVAATSAGSVVFIAQGTPVTADYDVQADLYDASNVGCAGVGSRWNIRSANGYFVRTCSGSGLQFYKYANGTLTALGSSIANTFTVGATTTLKLSTRTVSGNAVLTIYVNNISKGVYTDSASPILSAGEPVVFFNNNGTTPSDTTGQQLDNFLATDAVTANAIAISSPVSYQVFQKNAANTANITISGVFTGSPAAIEASWNGGAYQTIAVSPTGRTFNGTLANQPVGQGTLTVRFVDSPTTSATTTLVGVGDVFVVAGQSNATGQGTNNQSYSSPTFKAGFFGFDYLWKELADPTGSNVGQVDSIANNTLGFGGSVWPLLASYVMANENEPVAFIEAPLDASPLVYPKPNTPPWTIPANHEDRSTLYGQMIYRTRVAAPGGVKAVLWWQGESDMMAGNYVALYKPALVNLANTIYSDLGVKLVPAIMEYTTGLDPVLQAGIDGDIEADWSATPSIVAGPYLTDLVSDDTVHLKTDAHLAAAANRWWDALLLGFFSAPSAYTVSGTPDSTMTVSLASGGYFGPAAVNGVPDYTVTISDGGNGGTITPSVGNAGVSSVTVSPVPLSNSFTFTYTPAITGNITLTFANAQNWIDPTPITFYVPAPATAYTFTGPAGGSVNTASSVFTVTPNGVYSGNVTPSSSGAGTFSPAVLTFASSSAPQTFTYTPTSADGSPHIISVSSNPTLIDPAPINYFVSP